MSDEWISLTHEDPVDPKRRILDPHHHFWGADDCHDLGHAYPHEQLLAEMGGHDVAGSVYIECDAAWRKDGPEHLRPVGETASVAAQAKRTETGRAPIRGIVGWADLKLGDAVQEVLDAHREAGDGLFRGTRLAPVRTADVIGLGFDGIVAKIRSRPVFVDPAYRAGIACMGRNGFSLDAFAISYQLPDLAALALKPGAKIGWILRVTDDDNQNTFKSGWARKSVLLMPNAPAFSFDHDPRSCGELVIE